MVGAKKGDKSVFIFIQIRRGSREGRCHTKTMMTTKDNRDNESDCFFYYEQQLKRELKRIHISGCRCT